MSWGHLDRGKASKHQGSRLHGLRLHQELCSKPRRHHGFMVLAQVLFMVLFMVLWWCSWWNCICNSCDVGLAHLGEVDDTPDTTSLESQTLPRFFLASRSGGEALALHKKNRWTDGSFPGIRSPRAPAGARNLRRRGPWGHGASPRAG